MQEPQCLVFGPFRLDLSDERLWRGDEAIPLSPKTFAVLRCLVTQAGRLVTKDALLEAVWPATVVSESILTVAMRTLRRVLGDQARTPRFIETVHGRGYRFVAPVSATMSPERPMKMEKPHRLPSPTVSSPSFFVGRDAELAQLAQWWTTVQQGQRQVGMLVGEPGIGKTALVEAFVSQVRATEDVWVGHGQCVDQYGAGEAYLPVLEALGRLCREPAGTPLVSVLRQCAPSWLVHLPALLTSEDRERLERVVSGVTPARMLRELAEALEVLTATRPLVLVLEDLHWSDRATVEWLAYVVRRRDPARLLILGTYRPVDVLVHAHPLHAIAAELRHHPQYAELVLDYLSAAAVTLYLRQRCEAKPIPPGLPQLLHQRTSGNPLFLVAMVDELGRQGLLETGGEAGGSQEALTVLSELVPTSLRQYIEQHLEQLSEADQALLEAASVAGSTFAVAAVATGVAQAPETLEARYTALARQGRFIRASSTEIWPDGTVTACYQFIHALYHEVVYARVSAGHRVRLHQQIGARKEAGYGAQALQIAAELAVHFMRGHDPWRAVTYLHYAGENALRRSAYQEAITQLTTGLEVLATLPEASARAQQELDLRMALGSALMVTKGPAAPEVEQTYARAWALCQQVGETPQRFPTLRGLWRLYQNRGALPRAQELGEQLLQLAQRAAMPTDLLMAHGALGYTLYFLGDYGAAKTHCAQGIALIDSAQQQAQAFRDGVASGVVCLMVAANTLWCLGSPAQAVQRSQDALALAQVVDHPVSLANAQLFAALLHAHRREVPVVQAHVEALLATAQGSPHFVGVGTCFRGWTLAMHGQDAVGLEQIRQGMATILAAGNFLSWSLCQVLLAEAVGHAGHVDEGLRLLAEALTAIEASGRGDMLAEAYRLQGALLLRQAVPDAAQAEACFQQALAVARRQQAKSWELRAATSLSRLWQHQGKRAAAYDLLAPVYGWFTEGFDTADLQEAEALLADLRA